jgi:hypothetical protein
MNVQEVCSTIRASFEEASVAGQNAMLNLYQSVGATADAEGYSAADVSKDGRVYVALKAAFDGRPLSYVSELAKVMRPEVRKHTAEIIGTADKMIAVTSPDAPSQHRNRQKVFLQLATAAVDAGAWSDACRDSVISNRASAQAEAAQPSKQFEKAKKSAIRAMTALAAIANLPAENKAEIEQVKLAVQNIKTPNFVAPVPVEVAQLTPPAPAEVPQATPPAGMQLPPGMDLAQVNRLLALVAAQAQQ